MVRLELVIIALSLLLMAKSAIGQGPPQAEDFIVADTEALLSGLKLEKVELAAVKAALDKGDVDGAANAYIAYFRTKEMSSPVLKDWSAMKRNPKYNRAGVDRYLAGHLKDGYNVYEVPEAGIDWYDSPLICLTRFPIFGSLRYAIYHTEEPRYVRFVVDHISEYMQAYPIEEFVGKGTQGSMGNYKVCRPWHWCMMPQRIGQVCEMLVLIRKYPQVTDEELLQILYRMYEETKYIRIYMHEWVDRRHNGGLGYIGGMAQACKMLEDFSVAEEWRQYNTQSLVQYINEAFYPDGGCIELSTAYSGSVCYQVEHLAYLLQDEPGIQAAKGKVAAMVGWAIGLGKPTGRLPSFGDLGAGHFTNAIYEPLLDWLELPWADTMIHRTDGPLPEATVWPAEGQEQWCGYYSMRSDWTPEAKYMCIDGGPWGTSHSHGDKLGFVVTTHGADFIVDPTSTKYRSNEPDAFISRQQAGFLHNTITVDGVDEYMNGPREVTEPLGNTWEHGDNYSLFVSSYSFEPVKAADWQRRVLFADKSYWLLQDVITGEQESAQIEQNFQFAKDIEVEFRHNMTIAKAPNGARLVLVPLSGSLKPQLSIGDKTPHTTYWYDGKPKQDLSTSTTDDQPHGRGWIGHGKKLMPAPAVTYVGKVKLPGMITVALIPLKPEQSIDDLPEIAAEAADGVTTWTLPITGGSVRLTTSVDSCEVQK